MGTVWVTNMGEESFEDCHLGMKYEFKPGIPTAIPVATAVHIFGYGVEDKSPQLVRLGWLKYSNELEAALAKLGKFKFSSVAPEQSHEVPSVVDGVAPPSLRGRGAKRLHAV